MAVALLLATRLEAEGLGSALVTCTAAQRVRVASVRQIGSNGRHILTRAVREDSPIHSSSALGVRLSALGILMAALLLTPLEGGKALGVRLCEESPPSGRLLLIARARRYKPSIVHLKQTCRVIPSSMQCPVSSMSYNASRPTQRSLPGSARSAMRSGARKRAVRWQSRHTSWSEIGE